jgi:hypothetical protein
MAATGKVFETVTNSGGEVATTSIKFGYSNVEQQSQFSGYDGNLKDWTQQQTSQKLGARVKKFAKDQLANAAEGAINLAQRTVSSAIQGFTLGNVFGARNEIFSAIQNPQALANAAVGAALQNGDTIQPIATAGGATNLGDNPLGDGVQPGTTLTGENNIFPTPVASPLTTSDDVGGNLFPPGAGGPPLEPTNIFD